MMLKADFHVHTSEDPEDAAELSARELIDVASALGYDVLCITNHNVVTYDEDLKRHAGRKGILLIPGAEISVCGRKHVLVINSPLRGGNLHERVRSFGDLAAIGGDGALVIAPHPFHKAPVCLGASLEENASLFDAIESSHFHSRRLHLNRRAEEFARRHGLPLVGTSDAHFRFQFGSNYTLVGAEKNVGSVVAAVKEGRVEVVSPPLTVFGMGMILLRMSLARLARSMGKARRGNRQASCGPTP